MAFKRILLVEDDRDHVALTLRALRKHQVADEVATVSDGVEALDYLFARGSYTGRSPSDLPTLVLLDLKLPRVDGLEVLRQVRADDRTRILPVVMLTSSDDEGDLVRSYTLGANSYVRKPVDFREFMEAARQIGTYWLQLNESPVRA